MKNKSVCALSPTLADSVTAPLEFLRPFRYLIRVMSRKKDKKTKRQKDKKKEKLKKRQKDKTRRQDDRRQKQ